LHIPCTGHQRAVSSFGGIIVNNCDHRCRALRPPDDVTIF
jgi:hypothetical protein